MSVLKHLRDKVVREGERKMDRWLQDVDAQECEVDKLRKEIKETKRGSCPSKSRLEVHNRVITILGVVVELKRIGNRNVLKHRIGVATILKGNDVQHNGDGRSSESVERFISQMAREKPLRFSSKEIKSFTSNLSSRLGRRGYGEVFKGEFPNGVQIAVKVLKDNVRDVVKKMFMAEVGTMGRTYHRNLVRLYGFCFEANMKALVFEFVEKGSLDKILYENHLNLEWEKLYDIATDTAKDLSYLHENCHKRIIHCDVRAGNVLIDSNLCPNVADFGLAKLCNWDSSHCILTRFRGRSMLPLSFGMMLFEILRRKKNINRNVGEQQKLFPGQVWEKFKKGQLEEIIMDCGIEVKDKEKAKTLSVVALWCAQYVPEIRPSVTVGADVGGGPTYKHWAENSELHINTLGSERRNFRNVTK
ncbi:hypothetical protein ACHQM5_006805 [Ranunculus cassubicifolius]